jgi:hypothetical protein
MELSTKQKAHSFKDIKPVIDFNLDGGFIRVSEDTNYIGDKVLSFAFGEVTDDKKRKVIEYTISKNSQGKVVRYINEKREQWK